MEKLGGGRMLYHVYCDESRQTADRYMIIGGVIVAARDLPVLQQALQLFRRAHNLTKELKWTKVTDQKLAEYRALIDLVFSLSGALHFKCIVIDTTVLDHRRYSKGDKEVGFHKLMYQFLLHQFGGYVQEGDKCIVHLDQRNSRYKLSTLCAILNNGLRKKRKGQIKSDVFRNVEAVDSKTSDLMQVADVLMGAIGYHWNNLHVRPGARQAKVLLADYIATKARIPSLAQETPFGRRSFAIWHFKLRSGPKE